MIKRRLSLSVTFVMAAALVALLSLALAPLAAARPSAAGNTWTVGGACGTTIQACINVAAEGDTILIPSGTYNEFVRLQKPVSLIGLSNSSGQRPTIKSSTGVDVPLLVYPQSGSSPITASTVISNLILTGGRVPTSCGGGLRLYSTSPTLRDLIVTGNTAGAGAGICMYWGPSPVMINVVITGNVSTAYLNNFGSGGALNINGSPQLINVLVANNQDNTGRGQIEVMGGAPTFLHSTIVGSGNVPGIWVDPSATVYLTNTVIASHTIGISSTGTVLGDYNLFFGNGTNRVGAFTTGAHDVYGDPAFVNPAAGNFHLRSISTAIDRGVNAGVAFDVDGEVRPQGLGYDIGFDETPFIDSDNDGLSDAQEIRLGTDPHNPDTDGDGLPDGWEVGHDFNPLSAADASADPDNDGLSNLGEYQHSTHPRNADTDGDGLPDGWEVSHGLNPLSAADAGADLDNDGLSNLQEYQHGTDPANADTDHDGMPDGWEVSHGLNPLSAGDASADSDNDGLSNLQEYQHGTDPANADTDHDGLPDGWEVSHGLNPLVTDASADPDHDGLTNLQEYQRGTDPHNADTDQDGMPDGWEVSHGLNPLNAGDASADSDGDGLANLQEYQQGTDPFDPDSDHDGYSDAVEVAQGTNPLDPNSHPAVSAAVTGVIGSPQTGQYLSSTQALVAGSAAALNGLVSVQVSPNGSTWYTATGTNTWAWAWALPVEDGVPHLLQARARDRIGQIAMLTPTNVIVDRVAPVASITYPPLGHVIRSHTEVISGTASDGSGLARQQVSVDDGATWYDATPGTSWSWPWSIPAEDGVSHLLRVRTTDRAGNVSAPAATLAVFVDNVAPTLSYLNLPTNGQTTINTTTLTVIGRSSGALTTTLDSGSGPQIVTVVGNTFTRTINLVVTGTHVLTSTAVDGVGNLTLITSTLEVRPQQPPAPHRLFLPLVLRNFDPQRDRYESDDTVADARLITTDGVPQRHNFYPVNDVDWVWFEAAPGTYIISANGLAADTDTVLRLYASNGVTKLAENDDCTSTTRSSCLTWQVTTGGTLYVQIAPYDQTSSGAERWYDVAIVKQ